MEHSEIKQQADLIIIGATPAGIAAAIAGAEQGLQVIVLERLTHIGGLPANGLGATDIATRGVAGGLFKAFTERIHQDYITRYGAESPQVAACSNGFHFEPSVAERILTKMLAEHPSITVFINRQFDALPARVKLAKGKISEVQVVNRDNGRLESYAGKVFIDATYEGDLAAAAGVPFTLRREGFSDYREPMAGRVFQAWGSEEIGEGSTGEGDDTIQAYNFRLCLTDCPENKVPIPKPANYNRSEYVSLLDDLRLGRMPGVHQREREWEGIGRVVNIVWLPNGKTDANNQHLAFISTDLPEENYPWPTADWNWRDQFQERLRGYTLGLLWFMQNDPEVPQSFRENAARFGLAADEYQDNGNFPRQVYVREGRRIEGLVRFLAHDAIPPTPGARPPIHPTSIAASHYPVDSHAVRKREEGRAHLDGFITVGTKPYTVPYGIMVAECVSNLWTPVAVSASHLGFGTLRMEPCWMALGEAAGVAAAVGAAEELPAAKVPIADVQRILIQRGAMLLYFRDVSLTDPACPALQYLGVRGVFPEWEARLDQPVEEKELARWRQFGGADLEPSPAPETRREALIRWWTALEAEQAGAEEAEGTPLNQLSFSVS